ncbi:hypothetical protein [Telmatospirillum sp.]|uniref:hypothetical protein n=1 Tax=Telmatospirillum sp. TaxID=2079197 RepID=UPI00283CF738|nr:hypothetical protein [Telmatospirillum sp.]MDR3436836.1 hypothetical protein [Telmatospirillum sp.]
MRGTVDVRARVPLALAAVTVVVIAIEAASLGFGGTLVPPPQRLAPPPEPPAAAPLSSLETIFARPLFQPGRRSSGHQTTTARGTETLPRLTGIVVDGEKKIAVFQPAGEKPRVVKEGDAIGGWTIQAIGRRQVVLQKPGGTMTIEPAKDLGGSPAAAVQTNRNVPFQGTTPPAPMSGAPLNPGQAPRP